MSDENRRDEGWGQIVPENWSTDQLTGYILTVPSDSWPVLPSLMAREMARRLSELRAEIEQLKAQLAEAQAALSIARSARDKFCERAEAAEAQLAALRETSEDYSMMLRRLAHKLRADPKWRERILGLLLKHGGMGSILRSTKRERAALAAPTQHTVECCKARVYVWENGGMADCGNPLPCPHHAAPTQHAGEEPR